MSEQDNLNNSEIRSPKIQEIIGYIPHWIIRWGITVIFATILILIIGSWVFKYPDMIKAQIVVSTINSPAPVVSHANGRINQLFVKNNQKVEQGMVLAVIENPANYYDIVELKSSLDSCKDFIISFDTNKMKTLRNDYVLGEIQPNYSTFIKNYRSYQSFTEMNYHNKKIKSVKSRLANYKIYIHQIKNQNHLFKKELDVTEKQYARSQKLFKNDLISEKDYEISTSSDLQKKQSYAASKSNLTNLQIQLTQLQESVLELEMQYMEKKKQLELSLEESYENIQSNIKKWEKSYVLKSSISGTVTFTQFWSKNQNVRNGDIVMTVVPVGNTDIQGRLYVTVQGSGKVKKGQEVNIKLNDFPHMEFGILRGIVESKSLVPIKPESEKQLPAYVIEISFPKGMITNYGKKLTFSQEMVGEAEIITDDLRLIEKIVDPIKSIMKK